MSEPGEERIEVDRFILDEIDTVPHLEALLLLRDSRPKTWTAEKMAEYLYVKREVAGGILDDLERQQFIVRAGSSDLCYRYEPKSEPRDLLVGAVSRAYRREMIRISTMIHSKASAPVREFARAFRISKERS